MNAILYTNTADYRKINKSEYLATVGNTTLTLYNSTNLLTPTFKARHKTDANYIYVDGLGYYYITNQITDSSVCYYICEKDVLYSNNISNISVTAIRQEHKYDMSITDNLLPLSSKRVIHGYSGKNSQTDTTHDYIIGVI